MPKDPKSSPDEAIETAKSQDQGTKQSTSPSENGEKIPEQTAAPVVVPNRFKRFTASFWRRRLWTLPLTLLVLAAVVLAVPATRYPVLGLFVKTEYAVIVTDTTSGKPVSKAQVTLGSTVAQTDAEGKAKLHAAVGKTQLDITKKYYAASSRSVLVPIKQKEALRVSLRATGRQVPVTVVNRISGKPVDGATLAAADTEVKTDKDGKAVIVLPADKQSVEAKLNADGFNQSTVTVQVSEKADTNSFQVTPKGKVYFLSKQSGKLDVVKTNLDGSDRQTVLASTGKENQYDTVLLAARDWKYLALKSQRDGGESPKLFLIDAASDKVTTMDEGNADFTAVGWSNHRFVYTVGRKGIQSWQSKSQALKSYDAETGKLAVLDENEGEGTGQYDYAFNSFGQVYILDNELAYIKNWSSSYYGSKLSSKQSQFISVRPDGSAKRTVKEFPVPPNLSGYYVQLRAYEANGLYIQVPPENGTAYIYFEYENGKVAAKSEITEQIFNSDYPTYLVSPSGSKLFWSEQRDGKQTMFTSAKDGSDQKTVANISEFYPYGWYTDDYLIVSKKGSELYIMPIEGGTPVKITDYQGPNGRYAGYGYGYGGL